MQSLLNGSLKEKTELPDLATWKNQDQEGLCMYVLYAGFGKHLAQVALDEIPTAFRQSKVLRFDGRKLLPNSMFNATLADIVRLFEGRCYRSAAVCSSLPGALRA